MYVPRWLGYAVPRQTLDGLWGCLQAETCELVDWASREWADPSSLQDTRGEWRLTLTQGWRAWHCNISPRGPQTFGFEPELHPASSSVQCRCLGCHVSLRSCWVPSPWVSLPPPQPWFFSEKAWGTGDELVLFLCLKSVAPAQGRAVDRNPGAPGPGCPAVLGCLAASEQVGRWAVSETEQDWKDVQTLLWEPLKAWTFLFMMFFPREMIESLRWQTHVVEDSE